jgi:hypothetical protein
LTTAPTLAPPFTIRPTGGDDLPFILDSWSKAHRRGLGMDMAADAYKRHVQPSIIAILGREDVLTIAAYGEHDGRPDAILGWLAWTPGPLPTVHFAFVRGAHRQRGLFRSLLDDADIGQRFLYTFRGSRPKFDRKATTADERIVPKLARRGVFATFVDVTEWLEAKR